MSQLPLVQRAHDLYDSELTTEEIREKLVAAPSVEVLEWFEVRGVASLMREVNHSRNRTAIEAPQREPMFDEDGVQIPTAELPPLVNADGPTTPKASTLAKAGSRAIQWATTRKLYGRSWWDAADDLAFLLESADKLRNTANGLTSQAEVVEQFASDIESGTPKEVAIATLYQKMTGVSK